MRTQTSRFHLAILLLAIAASTIFAQAVKPPAPAPVAPTATTSAAATPAATTPAATTPAATTPAATTPAATTPAATTPAPVVPKTTTGDKYTNAFGSTQLMDIFLSQVKVASPVCKAAESFGSPANNARKIAVNKNKLCTYPTPNNTCCSNDDMRKLQDYWEKAEDNEESRQTRYSRRVHGLLSQTVSLLHLQPALIRFAANVVEAAGGDKICKDYGTAFKDIVINANLEFTVQTNLSKCVL